MKKLLLIGCLLLITACQRETPTPVPSLFTTETPRPTPKPVTVTPEPTFTAEPSSTPFPRYFTNEFDSSLAGWVILQAGSDAVPVITTDNNSLLVQLDSPNTWIYTLYGAQDYKNIHLDAVFEFREGSPSSVGLVCRYSEEKGWLEFNVSDDGTYNVLYGTWLATGIADFLPVFVDKTEYIRGEGIQQIGLTCADNILWLYANGKLFRKVDVSRYEAVEGKAGVIASSYNEVPVITSFESVKFSEPVTP